MRHYLKFMLISNDRNFMETPAMRSLLSMIFFLFVATVFAQSDLRRVSASALPPNIRDMQNISSAVRWTDSLGDHVMIITKKILSAPKSKVLEDYSGVDHVLTDILEKRKTSPSQYVHKANLHYEITPSFAYHFTIVNDSAILTWKVVGISRLCENENANHIKTWFVVTDLDSNFQAEVWLIYKGECIQEKNRGSMKIVMRENQKEYRMSGYIAGQEPVENYLDNNFRRGSAIFKNYVLGLWHKFLNQ